MGNVVGQKAPPPKSELLPGEISARIKELNEARGRLEKKQQQLSKQVEECNSQAAECHKKGDTTGAMKHLREVLKHEEGKKKLSGMISRMEEQVSTLSGAVITAEFLHVIRQAVITIKQVHEIVNIDKVDDIIEDIEAQRQIKKEIDDGLSRMNPAPSDVDEEALHSALAELEAKKFAEDMSAVPPVHVAPVAAAPAPAAVAAVPAAAAAPVAAAMSFPAVPTSVPAPPRSMADELEALEAASR